MAPPYRQFRADMWIDKELRLSVGVVRMRKEFSFGDYAAVVRGGRKAKVYRVDLDGRDVALKVFLPKFVDDRSFLITQQLRSLSRMPGLSVCRRDVIANPGSLAPDLIGLSWAVVMPWIEGRAWSSYIEEEEPIPQASAVALGRKTADILAALENVDLVHADISSTNVIVPSLTPRPMVELIDVEDMYHPDFLDVMFPPDGSPGYQHPRNVGQGCWNSYGDRFAASILLAEMLTWHQPAIRAARSDASLFGQDELCKAGSKYRLVHDALALHSPAVASLFAQAWNSDGLSSCPTLGQWKAALATARQTSELVTTPRFAPQRQWHHLLELSADPKFQTSFLAATTCETCNQQIRNGSPRDHAAWCRHHPTNFELPIDLTSLRTPSSRMRPMDVDALLAKFSAPSKPARPTYDDISFRPLTGAGPAPRPVPPPRPVQPPPFAPPRMNAPYTLPWMQPHNTRVCPKCWRTVTISGTTESGHTLTCSEGKIAKFIKNL